MGLSVLHSCSQLYFCNIFGAQTINLHKLIHRQIATSYSNNYCIALYLHKNSFTVITVDAFTFSLEIHVLSDLYRRSINVICKFLVNCIITYWLVNEPLVLFFQFCNHLVKSVNLCITILQMLQKLQALCLGFLAFNFNIKQVVSSLFEIFS